MRLPQVRHPAQHVIDRGDQAAGTVMPRAGAALVEAAADVGYMQRGAVGKAGFVVGAHQAVVHAHGLEDAFA